MRTIPKVSGENPKGFKNFLKKVKVTKCSSGRAEVSFVNFLKFFGRKSEKLFTQSPKKNLKRKIRKLFLPQFLLWTRRQNFENHAEGFCWTSKTIQNFRKKIQATNCSSGHVEGTFEKLLKFFGRKSEKFLLEIRKKFWKKNKKNCFLRNFYSGHVDRILRTMPKVSAEHPKRFKTLEKNFKPQTIPLDT